MAVQSKIFNHRTLRLVNRFLPDKIWHRISYAALLFGSFGSGAFNTEFLAKNATNILKESRNFRRAPDRPIILIDVGFSKGDFSRLVLENLDEEIRVIGFEIQEGINYNRDLFGSKLVLEHLALSDTFGMAPYFSDVEGSSIASLSPFRFDTVGVDHNIVKMVERTTLDFYASKNDIEEVDILKIDVEGHDFSVMLGAQATLRKTNIVVFEQGPAQIEEKVFFRNFFDLLSDLNFDIYFCGYNDLTLIRKYSTKYEIYFPTNFIAVSQKLGRMSV